MWRPGLLTATQNAMLVGMFIARVSYGRTVKQFIAGVLFLPTAVTFLWITAFANSAIHTIVRPGLEEDAPEAYAFLDRFRWSTEEMDNLMAMIQREDGLYPYRHARRWLRNRPERVASWLENGS